MGGNLFTTTEIRLLGAEIRLLGAEICLQVMRKLGRLRERLAEVLLPRLSRGDAQVSLGPKP